MKLPQVCDRIDILGCSTVKKKPVHLFGAVASSLSAASHTDANENSLDYTSLGPRLSLLTTRTTVGRAENESNSLLYTVVSLRYRIAQWVPA